MVHESIPGLVNALGSSIKVSTVYETKDHFLKDYVPYVQVTVKGRLNPEHWKIIQSQKGMLVLDAQCGMCDCIDFTGKSDSEEQVMKKGFMTLALTPINEAYESDRLNDWVEELQNHLDRAKKRQSSKSSL